MIATSAGASRMSPWSRTSPSSAGTRALANRHASPAVMRPPKTARPSTRVRMPVRTVVAKNVITREISVPMSWATSPKGRVSTVSDSPLNAVP